MAEAVSILIAGTVISGLVKVLLTKLTSAASSEFSLIYHADSHFRKLKEYLSSINAVLQDAEEKQSSSNPIRIWLSDLKDVVYDIEDLLDLISTQALSRKLNPTILDRLSFTRLPSRYTMVHRVKKICLRLDEIKEIQSKLGLQQTQEHVSVVVGPAPARDTHSNVRESDVFGRKGDKEWLISQLISSSGEISVVPVIGIGGIGKTTLAKLVYNDPRVQLRFNLTLWAFVSEKFDLGTVIERIAESAGKSVPNHSLESRQKALREALEGRTFLLVLDDVWDTVRADQWLELMQLLSAESRNCAIIVTTRDDNVAKLTGTLKSHRLQDLPPDDCWSIFARYAFPKGDEKDHPLLVKIGKSIILKCKGVPLSVKTLGSLLRNQREVDAWEKIEQSEKVLSDILATLKLSLDHTPYHQRCCFTYCAMFGKGYPLHRQDMINVWMAQGLLVDSRGTGDAMEVGDEYFDELLSRSFFQFPGYSVTEKYVMEAAGVFKEQSDWINLAQSFKNNMMRDNVDSLTKWFTDYRGKIPFVEMHDLMHDLAVLLAGEEVAIVKSSTSEIPARARHIAWEAEDLSGKDFPIGLKKPSKARTFAFLHPVGTLSKSFLESLLSNFKCLRVLILMKLEFEEIPDLIKHLKHLRYIDISVNSSLKQLPNAICRAVNLQVLDFGHCSSIQKLPKDMHKLVSLVSLIVTFNGTCLPTRGFQCLSSLRILKIINCPNLTSLPDNIGSLKGLKVLGVELCSALASLPDMEHLTDLEELSIGDFHKVDLEGWKGLFGLKNLKFLRLYGIPKLVHIPTGIQSMGKSLQLLRIGECEKLTSLPEELHHCTHLLKLQLFGCPALTALPTRIQELEALQELKIAGCQRLSKRFEKGNRADWPLISHISNIYIEGEAIQINKVPTNQE